MYNPSVHEPAYPLSLNMVSIAALEYDLGRSSAETSGLISGPQDLEGRGNHTYVRRGPDPR